MKKETPHSEKRGAGLADGWKTVAPVAGIPTTGRDPGKAQSERAKRGLRHIDPSVASSARPSGAGSRHQTGQRRRLGSGQQDRSKALGPAWPLLARAGRPVPSARALSNQHDLLSTTTVLEIQEFET